MNAENTGMRSGGLNRPDTPSSGSHVSGSNEVPAKLLTEIAAMDYEMKILENKIKSKKEEEQRLLEAKYSNLTSLSNLKKQVTSLQERERSFTISVDKVKGSSTTLEGLETAVIKNLSAIKISTEEQKSKCHTVIEKYSTIINSHKESFAALPWVKENKLLSAEIEKKRVKLGKLKMQQQRNNAKISMLKQISEKRMRIEILGLAILMKERGNCLRDESEKEAQYKMMEQEIRSLEEQKFQIQERIASKTQEMINRIMSRSSNRPQKPSAPLVFGKKTPIDEETNKPANLTIKDRLGIGRRQQDDHSTSLSIKDGLGITKKPINVDLAPISQIRRDETVEPKSLMAPSTKHGSLQFTGGQLAGPWSSIPIAEDPAESMENSSNRDPISSTAFEQHSGTGQIAGSSPPEVQQDLHLTYPEGSISITAAVSLPPSLKAILKSSSTVTKPSETPTTDLPPIVSPRLDDEIISTTVVGNILATTQSKHTQNASILSGEVSCVTNANERRLTDSDLQPYDTAAVIEAGPPPLKKRKVAEKMPPPRPTAAPQKMIRPNQPPKTPKRVSFVAEGEETRQNSRLFNIENERSTSQDTIDGSALGKGTSSHEDNLSNPTSQLVANVEFETKNCEPCPKRVEPVSNFVEPVVVSDSRTSTPELASTSQGEQQTTEPEADKFCHIFSPSPQPYTTLQQQVSPGNFDSLFGAIFDTPNTSKDNAEFQFNIQGDKKQDGTAPDATNPSSNNGQDFFSFFGTPNANEAKKSYNDNFFKLF